MPLGKLTTSKPIESAIREVREWLQQINVDGLTIDMRYDARANVALVRFSFGGKNYEFRSAKQNNCRLNMWAIARAMESKVRNHIMGIEPFEKSMQAYLLLEGPSVSTEEQPATDVTAYATLGITPLASNEEIIQRFKKLSKMYHPDMSLSIEGKEEFAKRFADISNAFTKIKKERNI